MPLNRGTHLGSYEILGPLGSGGMGEVYRAKDLRLGREVAVKVLPEAVASNPDRLARFEREARTIAGLNHPNIVTLHSVEDANGVRFLTMELVEGQPLSNLVTPGGLPFARILELSIPLADALVAAHERGVIHRDLKPGNVMVTREGRVKVLDFGLARVAANEEHASLRSLAATEAPISEERQILGTWPYMAPEQLRGEPADARSDLFSLGVILYELAAGRRPFTGESSAEVASCILRDAPEPLSRVRADLPGDLEWIVSRCLEKSPQQRVHSALEVNNELRRLRKALERGGPERPVQDRVASIAVLPFVNRSASADDEYFSDGLADELLNVLSRIRGLRVTARSSAFTFKGKQATAAEIGRALNVATLLEGSVRKAGNRIRVSVQLVKVSDGYHIWSETYDRTLEDIFAVQDDIAQSVVKELRTALLGEEADSDASGKAKAEVVSAAKGRATNSEAYRLYLLARHFMGRFTRADTEKAIEYQKQALELDPEFALAWVELGWAHCREADYGWVPAIDGYRRAREAAERALALEPDLAEGHAETGWIQMHHEWDWRGAEVSFRRALELSPGNAVVLRRTGVFESSQGRIEEAIGLYRRALEQDPLDSHTYNNIAIAFHELDRQLEAQSAHRKALELAPQRAGSHGGISMALIAQGRGEEALAEASREPDEGTRLWALTIVQYVLGNRGESDKLLRELIDKYADVSAWDVAEVHAARGEVDAAFRWLDRAYAQREGGLSGVKKSPRLRSLHDEPRWVAFLKKMRFDD